MIASYPYETIVVNNRHVSLMSILETKAVFENEFEKNTFDFIRKWFSGDNTFTLNTSGSTGPPKTIELSRIQLETSAKLTAAALDLRSGNTALVCLDTRYIAGQMMLVRSFTVGMHIIAIDPQANPFQALTPNSTIDFTALVPYNVFHILRSQQSTYFNHIKTIIIGGATVDVSLKDELLEFSCACYETYGMTETISHIGLKRINGNSPEDFFKTLPGISVTSDDRSCLQITAPYLTKPVLTNDIVDVIDSTTFRWLGRWDNVINSGGVKISPERIEEILESVFREINLHHRIIISSQPDATLGNKIVLVIEGKIADESLKSSLFEHFLKHLASYHRPKKILELPIFPQTNTGKIDRLKVKKMISEQPQN